MWTPWKVRRQLKKSLDLLEQMQLLVREAQRIAQEAVAGAEQRALSIQHEYITAEPRWMMKPVNDYVN